MLLGREIRGSEGNLYGNYNYRLRVFDISPLDNLYLTFLFAYSCTGNVVAARVPLQSGIFCLDGSVALSDGRRRKMIEVESSAINSTTWVNHGNSVSSVDFYYPGTDSGILYSKPVPLMHQAVSRSLRVQWHSSVRHIEQTFLKRHEDKRCTWILDLLPATCDGCLSLENVLVRDGKNSYTCGCEKTVDT